MRKFAILLAGATLLAGCQTAPPAEPVVAVPAVDPANPLFAPGYMAMAASGDLFEIQSAQLAHQRAQSPAVHNLASLLETDHRRMSQTMAAAAASAGLAPPPPALLPQHQALLDQLNAAGSGPSFDRAFHDVQMMAHQQALQLHQNYAASGDNPALRAVASQAVPVIQGHLQQTHSLMGHMAPPTVPPPPPRSGERG